MSVQTEIDRITQNVANTYAVLDALGADLPAEQTSDNLPITAGTAKALLYSEQSLTDAQKLQARKNIGAGTPLPSVTDYGAKGDGVTDDTVWFQTALAENRVVFVPGGTYILKGTLTIRQNCRLNLSQDTVLKFTQTSGNCIELRSSSTLSGNHGIIQVPYAFTGNVVSSVTTGDETRDTPPFVHWDPQWKRGRYIYDVCIIKPDTNGLCYMRTGGSCTGNAIYLSCDGESTVRFMWGVMMQGVRISGAFSNGIKVINYDNPAYDEDNAWNHDMRIEAVIEFCETGVSLTNCNDVHLAATIQPHCAQDEKTPYAKWGVYINDCRYIDMASSVVWDWNSKNTKYTDGGEYTAVAMYGNCPGLILNDYGYYNNSTETRDRIYTNVPSNLEKMTILQEPITKWFKTTDGVAYYFNGNAYKKLATQEDLGAYFDADMVKGFTDVLATATDTDGTIYNKIGYKAGYRLNTDGSVITSADTTYTLTGFMPCAVGQKVYVAGMSLASADDACRICLYDRDKNFIRFMALTSLTASGWYIAGEKTEDGFWFSVQNVVGTENTAYFRINVFTRMLGEYPMISVNEEIKYKVEGFLSDGVKVKGDNMILYSPGGKAFRIAVSDAGEISAAEVSV